LTNSVTSRAHRPTFAALEAAYPATSRIEQAELFQEIGIEALTGKIAYLNTCAIRMSYGLTKAGVTLKKGGLKINIGPHKGKRIEPSMKKLAEHLVELWGQPEKFDTDAAAKTGLAMRKGVIVFFFGEFLPLVGAQGHIDLLRQKPSGFAACVGTCFFKPKNKIWFWPLQ
jgi:hypothetical protein